MANPGDALATVAATYVRAYDPQQPSTATPIVRSYQLALASLDVRIACTDGTRARTQRSLNAGRTTLWLRPEFAVIVGRQCAATMTSQPVRIGVPPSSPSGSSARPLPGVGIGPAAVVAERTLLSRHHDDFR
jgi:hypothetical protein